MIAPFGARAKTSGMGARLTPNLSTTGFSVAVAMLILKSAWSLVKRSAHILLEGAPEWLNVEEMQSRIVAAVPGVCGIHHVHVWGLTPQALMLTMHVRLDAETPNPTDLIRDVKNYLRKEQGIGHCTIEIEIDDCADIGLAPVEAPHGHQH